MKIQYSIIVLFLFCVIKNGSSQNMLSFTNLDYENKNEVKNITNKTGDLISETPKILAFKNEIRDIESSIEMMKVDKYETILEYNEKVKRKIILEEQNKEDQSLNDSIFNLEKKKQDQESIISNLSEALFEKIKKLSEEYKIDIKSANFLFAGNLSVNALGQGDGTKIMPELAANFHENFNFGKSIFWIYEVNLILKAPILSSDSEKVLTSIVNAGADGSLDLGLKLGWSKNKKKFALLAGIDGKLNWLYARDFDSKSVSSIGYGIFSTLVAIKIYPIVVAIQGDYSFTSESQNNFFSNELDDKWSTNLLIGLSLENYQLQIKYLLNSSVAKIPDERLEIKLGVAYDPF